jgi:phosphosulfolactate synthase (CoM biosynthesis protein A)
MARINIEIEDILWDMSDREKQELVDDLYDDGYIAKKSDESKNADDEWNEQVHKLFNNNWRLSKEDEETILRIANKLTI